MNGARFAAVPTGHACLASVERPRATRFTADFTRQPVTNPARAPPSRGSPAAVTCSPVALLPPRHHLRQ